MTSTQNSVTPRATVRPLKVAGRQSHRDRHRVVRLRHLRHGRGNRVRPVVLPVLLLDRGDAGRVRDVLRQRRSVPVLGLAGPVPGQCGLVIRFTISESPDFEKVESTHRDQRLPIVTVLRENLREVLLAAGAFIGINTVGYTFMAYLLSYSTKVLGMTKTLVLLVTGSVGLTVWAAALFPLIDLRNPPVIAALFTELFSAEVRYSGASLGYQIGSVLGGGLAPTVAAALYANWGSSAPISLYLTAVTLLSLLCVVAITRKVRAAA